MKNIDVPIFMTDFEGSRKIGVVEYGTAEIFGGDIIGVQTGICRPKIPIPQRDAEFFGIDNAAASAKPPFSEAINFFCDMRKRGIMASHNACVEDSLLRDTLPSPGKVSDFVTQNIMYSWGPWIDTMTLSKNLFPDLKSAKLSDLIKSLDLQEKLDSYAKKYCPETRRKWHSALYDAIAAALVFLWIISQDGFENVTVEWLLKYSGHTEENSLFEQ